MKLAQNKAETYALKNLARSWLGLAGQIDRYNAIVASSKVRGGPSLPPPRRHASANHHCAVALPERRQNGGLQVNELRVAGRR